MKFYRVDLVESLSGGTRTSQIVIVEDPNGLYARRADVEAIESQLNQIQIDAQAKVTQ